MGLEFLAQEGTNHQRTRIEVEAIAVDTITYFDFPPASGDLANKKSWFTQTYFMGVKSAEVPHLHSLQVYRGRGWRNKEILIMVDPRDPTDRSLWDWYILRSKTSSQIAEIISCCVDWNGLSDYEFRQINSMAANISIDTKMTAPISSKGPMPENYGTF